MQRVWLDVTQDDIVKLNIEQSDDVTMDITEKMASYEEMMEVLETYIDWMFTHFVSNLRFCDELPEEGEEDILYICKDDLKAYMWTGEFYVEISAGSGDFEIATDEEVQEMLDEVFGPIE